MSDSSQSSMSNRRRSSLAPFVHLRVHTAYSLLEGALHIQDLAQLAQAHAMPAVAMTDRANLFGALEFSETLAKAGIQPIIGVTLPVVTGGQQAAAADDVRLKSAARVPPCLVLLAQNETGYRNLLKLVSAAHLESADERGPAVTIDRLAERADGLICLSGAQEGPIGERLLAGDAAGAETCADHLSGIFPGRFYIELQRHGLALEERLEPEFLKLAFHHDWPLVATNQCYFRDASMYEAHDALRCIAGGHYVADPDRPRLTPHHGFKSADEMVELFHDIPEAVRNTLVIARRCAWRPQPIAPILPSFSATGGETEEEILRRQAAEGLHERLEAHVFAPQDDETARKEKAKPYEERLAYELDIITKMGFPGYFLIVSDFIRWAKDQGIPVGPGRGSGAGSLVAWALRITDLDPLRFSLLFERFLNPERVSMPDFDIDFCQDRREEVIRYVQEKYGHDRVAQIITFGKLQARAVLRDVGRVMQQPYPVTDRLCKLVPNNPADPKTLAEALAEEPRLEAERRSDPLTATVIDRALKLEGLYRHASTHAAGVVIGDRPLDELVPLYRDPRSDMPVTQFNMKWVEQAGLVKFDFLGLKTLTVLARAVDYVKRRGVTVDLSRIPLDDSATFALLARGETAGVFQLESAGMRAALKGLKPDKFEDIIALVALYRPGPMDNIPVYVNRKHGLEPVEYPHPMLEEILAETYGVIIYQEQVMQIAQVMAGYSLGEADLLRRAMGKKIKQEMDRQRARFVEGAVERGVERAKADWIFDLVAKFAGYGFNKSHAAAYALVAYHTAFMKANHPVEFMAATMSLDMHNTDKLAHFAHELEQMGIALLPPDINRSGVAFEVEACEDDEGATKFGIRYALAAIKGVGEKVMEEVVRVREEGGVFRSLTDFAERIDPHVLNRRQLEQLAAAGAFDALENDRARVFAAAERIMRHAAQAHEARTSTQSSLFGADSGVALPELRLGDVARWSKVETLSREQAAVGFYLSAHPLDAYEGLLRRLRVRRAADVLHGETADGAELRMAGIVENYYERRARKSGRRFGVLELSDPSGSFELLVFEEQLPSARTLVEGEVPILAEVEARRRDDELRLSARSLVDLDARAQETGTGLELRFSSQEVVAGLVEHLADARGGRGTAYGFVLLEGGEEAVIELGQDFRVTPRLVEELRALPGIWGVEEL